MRESHPALVNFVSSSEKIGCIEQQTDLRSYLEREDVALRLVVISDTHGLHDRIEGLPDGDVLVHAGDFMNSGYDVQEVLSFNRWLGEQSFKRRVV